MKNAIVVATLFLVIAAVSCKKDDDVSQPTTFQMITSSTWKIDTIGWDMDKNGVIDGAVVLTPCQLDNTLTFSSDSSGVFDEGSSKCETGDDQSTAFDWSLNDSTKILTIVGDIPGQLGGDLNVVSVDDTSLVLSKNVVSTFPVQFNGNLIVALQK